MDQRAKRWNLREGRHTKARQKGLAACMWPFFQFPFLGRWQMSSHRYFELPPSGQMHYFDRPNPPLAIRASAAELGLHECVSCRGALVGHKVCATHGKTSK